MQKKIIWVQRLPMCEWNRKMFTTPNRSLHKRYKVVQLVKLLFFIHLYCVHLETLITLIKRSHAARACTVGTPGYI